MSKLHVEPVGEGQIKMVRTFDAPRRLVVRAMSEPELIKRWLGNSRGELVSVEVDFRVGGRYRYGFRRTGDGGAFALGGVFREIGDGRIVQVESMEGMPGEAIVTTTLVEQGGKTTLTVISDFGSREVRDIVLATGMADGAGESYDNLERLVTTL